MAPMSALSKISNIYSENNKKFWMEEKEKKKHCINIDVVTIGSRGGEGKALVFINAAFY